jgi:hypothetical protein
MVSARIFSPAFFFLTVISKGTERNHICRELVARKNASKITCNKIGSPGNNC